MSQQRQRLPARRFSVTKRVKYVKPNGDDTTTLTVTIGFDPTSGKAQEVFCADFKAGSEFHAIITDSCILLSRLLQHGNTPADILSSLSAPASLVGTLIAAVHNEQLLIDRELNALKPDEGGPPVGEAPEPAPKPRSPSDTHGEAANANVADA